MKKKNKIKEFFRLTKGKIILGIVIFVILGIFSFSCGPKFVDECYSDFCYQLICGSQLGIISEVLLKYWPITLIISYLLSSLIIYYFRRKK